MTHVRPANATMLCVSLLWVLAPARRGSKMYLWRLSALVGIAMLGAYGASERAAQRARLLGRGGRPGVFGNYTNELE